MNNIIIEKIQKWLIFVFVLFIFGLPIFFLFSTMIQSFYVNHIVVPVVSLAVCSYTLYLIIKLRNTEKFVKERDRLNIRILLGLLIGICYGAFLFTIITISPLLGLNVDLVFLAVIILSYCFAFVIIGFGIYKGLKRKGISLGLNKSKLLIAVTDYLVAGLIIYLAILFDKHAFISYTMIIVGFLIAFLATVQILIKANNSSTQ
jgi:hypothetical protein